MPETKNAMTMEQAMEKFKAAMSRGTKFGMMFWAVLARDKATMIEAESSAVCILMHMRSAAIQRDGPAVWNAHIQELAKRLEVPVDVPPAPTLDRG